MSYEYDQYLQQHNSSRLAVEGILALIKIKLEENNNDSD